MTFCTEVTDCDVGVMLSPKIIFRYERIPSCSRKSALGAETIRKKKRFLSTGYHNVWYVYPATSRNRRFQNSNRSSANNFGSWVGSGFNSIRAHLVRCDV